MLCRECPYIKEEFEKRLRHKSQNIRASDFADELECCCWCNKTGGKVWWYGQCSDGELQFNKNWNNRKKTKKPKKRMRKCKIERDMSYKRKLKRRARLWQGVYLVDDKYVRGQGYIPIGKPYYQKFYRGNRYYKNYSNHCVRRFKGDISNGNAYRRIFDYWWTID